MSVRQNFANPFVRVIVPMAVMALLLTVGIGVSVADDDAKQKAPDIAGAWRLHGRLAEDGQVTPLFGEEASQLIVKFFAGGRWSVTYADRETGAVGMHHGGSYTLIGDKYAESIDFATEPTAQLVGMKLRFQVSVEGDTFTQKGIDNPYHEVWKRIKQDDQ